MIDSRRLRVLIADDDANIRRMITLALRKDGYQTTDATDGREALEVMRAGEADLVLLDLMMPNVTGWDVLAERADAQELRKIPIIVITAASGDGVAKIVADPTCALLPKPFELTTLRAIVKSSLEAAAAAAGAASIRSTPAP